MGRRAGPEGRARSRGPPHRRSRRGRFGTFAAPSHIEAKRDAVPLGEGCLSRKIGAGRGSERCRFELHPLDGRSEQFSASVLTQLATSWGEPRRARPARPVRRFSKNPAPFAVSGFGRAGQPRTKGFKMSRYPRLACLVFGSAAHGKLAAGQIRTDQPLNRVRFGTARNAVKEDAPCTDASTLGGSKHIHISLYGKREDDGGFHRLKTPRTFKAL